MAGSIRYGVNNNFSSSKKQKQRPATRWSRPLVMIVLFFFLCTVVLLMLVEYHSAIENNFNNSNNFSRQTSLELLESSVVAGKKDNDDARGEIIKRSAKLQSAKDRNNTSISVSSVTSNVKETLSLNNNNNNMNTNITKEERPTTVNNSASTNFDEERALHVFYNAFIPKNNTTYETVQNIISDQFRRIVDNAEVHKTPIVVRYNTIGLQLEHEKVLKSLPFTNRVIFHHINHYDDADEHVTLQLLYDYCVSNPNNRVTYLHDKGSFHPSVNNEYVRNFSTDAVLSHFCVDPPDKTCNICSFRFTPRPFFSSPGNMWTARCSYIRLLVPPTNYDQVLEKVLIKSRRYFKYETFPWQDRPSWQGTGRYAQEHWAYGHPQVSPCALYHVDNFPYGRRNTPMDFQMAPQPKKFAYQKEAHGLEFERYYELDGVLFRWLEIYKTVNENSWVWKYFQSGPETLSYIQEHTRSEWEESIFLQKEGGNIKEEETDVEV